MAKNYRSELTGVFGCPVDENPTGAIMEACYRENGLDYRYVTALVEPGSLGEAMAGLRAMHMRGINLTIPHKVEALKYLDELSPAARIIGAVNCVVNDGGRLWGDNTDGKGFIRALTAAGVDVSGARVTLLGAGGAARAIAVEAALAGAAAVHIVNRDAGRGEELAGLVRTKTPAESSYNHWTAGVTPPACDILVNGTSVGLYPNIDRKPDIDYNAIGASMVVSDVIFNDPNTRFLAEAARRGATVVNGLGMLARQAALNFRLWTGEEASIETMERVLRAEFGLWQF